MKTIRLLTLSAAAAMLMACGGGDETATSATPPANATNATSPTNPATPTVPTATQAAFIDNYIGVWTTTCLTNTDVDESGRFVSTISKRSDTVLNVGLSAVRFSGKTCTGTVLSNIFRSTISDIAYVNTVNDVDRFTYPDNSKATWKIVGSVLYVGNELTLDAAGYPVINLNNRDTAFIKN